jgi:DNA mismatch repair ATPase MutS
MTSNDKPSQLTPMLRQYHEIKKQYPGTLLFFRLGDFYELFYDDALLGAREMEITLTARHKEHGSPVPMCGVPHHAVTNYIAKAGEKGISGRYLRTNRSSADCNQISQTRSGASDHARHCSGKPIA